jgi:hypothetical protein
MMVRLIPALVLTAYVLTGLLVSIYGPVIYKDYSYRLVIAYLLSFLILFWIGYGFGLSVPLAGNRRPTLRNAVLTGRIFRICIITSALLVIGQFAIYFNQTGLSFDISNVGKAYLRTYAGYERNTGSYSLSFIIASVGAAPMFIATIWGLFYFRQISPLDRLLLALLIVSTLLIFTIGQGKQKQLGDFAIYAASLLAIGVGAYGRLRRRDIVAAVTVALVVGLGLSYIVGKRYEAINITSDNVNQHIHPLMRIRTDSILFSWFGEKLGFSLSILSQYLSSGYYGLSLGLKQDFYWTWFLGGSYSLSVIFDRWLGFPFMYELTYPSRVGQVTGWSESKWHSLFSWLASDMTYPGALIFLGFVGFFYARVWQESITYKNPFSILLFCLLNVGLVYIPANNQLAHSPGGLATVAVVLVLYFVYARRFNVARAAG